MTVTVHQRPLRYNGWRMMDAMVGVRVIPVQGAVRYRYNIIIPPLLLAGRSTVDNTKATIVLVFIVEIISPEWGQLIPWIRLCSLGQAGLPFRLTYLYRVTRPFTMRRHCY